MKILLIGNHACANRGDAAISRGLLQHLRQLIPQAKFDLISRFPTSSAYLLGEVYQADVLYAAYRQQWTGLWGRLQRFLKARYFSRYLALLVRYPAIRLWFGLPASVNETIKQLEQYDCVIQVGGSNLVDIYGNSQFDWALCSLIANRPLLFIGHSVGPFQSSSFRYIAGIVFRRCMMLQLRESLSKKMMADARLPMEQVDIGGDTAWLVDFPETIPLALTLTSDSPTVAITVRLLKPFDTRLNLTQQEFNQSIINCAEFLIAQGYRVLFVSTCTGIDGYNNDDRMLALQLSGQLTRQDRVTVEMRELNDIEIGLLLRQCAFTIATRLHSAIIAMNAGSIAIALSYEHKTPGILASLALPELCVELGPGFGSQLMAKINNLRTHEVSLKQRCEKAVIHERRKTAQSIERAILKWKSTC